MFVRSSAGTIACADPFRNVWNIEGLDVRCSNTNTEGMFVCARARVCEWQKEIHLRV